MATAKKTEVAVQATGELTFGQERPDWLAAGPGRGSENVGTADIVLPRLEIVQAQSPIKDANPDAAEGLLFNSATSEVLGGSVFIVPVYYRMEWLVWKDQDAGGGFFGAYDSQSAAEARINDEVEKGADADDLEIVDTPVHYCLRVVSDPKAPGGFRTEQIVIPMPKSKAKVSRKWNAMIQIAGGDRFSRVYKVSTFRDKNKQNKTFYNFVVAPAGFAPQQVYQEAESLYEVLRAGMGNMKVDHGSAGGDGESFAGDPSNSEI